MGEGTTRQGFDLTAKHRNNVNSTVVMQLLSSARSKILFEGRTEASDLHVDSYLCDIFRRDVWRSSRSRGEAGNNGDRG